MDGLGYLALKGALSEEHNGPNMVMRPSVASRKAAVSTPASIGTSDQDCGRGGTMGQLCPVRLFDKTGGTCLLHGLEISSHVCRGGSWFDAMLGKGAGKESESERATSNINC